MQCLRADTIQKPPHRKCVCCNDWHAIKYEIQSFSIYIFCAIILVDNFAVATYGSQLRDFSQFFICSSHWTFCRFVDWTVFSWRLIPDEPISWRRKATPYVFDSHSPTTAVNYSGRCNKRYKIEKENILNKRLWFHKFLQRRQWN